jgi:predicted kinase
MKIIVIGASTSGKTTLVNYLRTTHPQLDISEIDEELTKANDNIFPNDEHLKKDILAPRIYQEILKKKETIFFINTDFLYKREIEEAKNQGFKIVQLDLDLNKLKQRNARRVEEQKYQDMGKWLEDMVEYQEMIRRSGLIDLVIDADQSVEKIANLLLTIQN